MLIAELMSYEALSVLGTRVFDCRLTWISLRPAGIAERGPSWTLLILYCNAVFMVPIAKLIS